MKKSNNGRVASTPVMTYTSRSADLLASVADWLNQSLNFTRFTTISQLRPRVFVAFKSTSPTSVRDRLGSSRVVSLELKSPDGLLPRADSRARATRVRIEPKSGQTIATF